MLCNTPNKVEAVLSFDSSSNIIELAGGLGDLKSSSAIFDNCTHIFTKEKLDGLGITES